MASKLSGTAEIKDASIYGLAVLFDTLVDELKQGDRLGPITLTGLFQGALAFGVSNPVTENSRSGGSFRR